MARYIVVAEELDQENFFSFGQTIQRPEIVAPKKGEDWDCWVPLARLGSGDPSVGIVTTRPTDGIIRVMEREPKTEFLLPISGPVIQAVAPGDDGSEYRSQPSADEVRAFIIRPSQAIVMAPGTWHWAAIPLHDEEVLYYFATEIDEAGTKASLNPWIPFKNGDDVQVVSR